MNRLRGLLAAVALAAAGEAAAAEEPSDYRGPPYRGEVPETLGDAAAPALWWSGRVAFIDALPRPERPANLPRGTLWRVPPHETIPGATWLPNTGYDALAPETLDYFLAGVEAATGGDRAAPMVIFCKAECWMSWNAARRAVEHGFTRVFWYPEGVDGWTANGWPLAVAEPRGR